MSKRPSTPFLVFLILIGGTIGSVFLYRWQKAVELQQRHTAERQLEVAIEQERMRPVIVLNEKFGLAVNQWVQYRLSGKDVTGTNAGRFHIHIQASGNTDVVLLGREDAMLFAYAPDEYFKPNMTTCFRRGVMQSDFECVIAKEQWPALLAVHDGRDQSQVAGAIVGRLLGSSSGLDALQQINVVAVQITAQP